VKTRLFVAASVFVAPEARHVLAGQAPAAREFRPQLFQRH